MPENNELNKDNPANPNKDPFSDKQDTRLFYGGANTDDSKELLGAQKEGAKFYDATNFRVDDKNLGTGNAASRIRGEELLYSNAQNLHSCIGSFNVGNRIVEFWAPSNPTDGGIITIDGVVMCKSQDFPLTPDHQLQGDTNDDAIGQEIYITDFSEVMPPVYFSIADIILNWNNGAPTTKYFSGFVLSNFTINLTLPIDNIVFDPITPLVNVGSGGGLPSGQYSYAYCLVDSSGNITNYSIQTPLIFVPKNLEATNSQSPWTNLKTIGGGPDSLTPTPYGVKMNFRINNFNNYAYIQIIRIAYANGEPIDFAPVPLIVKTVPLTNGQFQIFSYTDCVNNQSQNVSNAVISTYNILSVIKRAKAIRYFYNKIILGNIEYQDRNVTGAVTFLESVNNNKIVPILQSIGTQGYKDPYNHAYFRSLMHGEIYGYYLVGWDSNFSRTLGIPIENVNGVIALQMPNKRDPLDLELNGDSLFYSPNSSIQASTRGLVEPTFETVDYKLGITRPVMTGENQTTGCNILDKGTAGTRKGNNIQAQQVGYRPFYPQLPEDLNESNVMYTPTDFPCDGGEGAIGGDSAPGNTVNYNPNMFNPNINALGVALVGLDSFPSWMSAFSVVRTKRANRVVCQGIGFWKMNDALIWNNNGQKGTGQKSRNQLVIHLPDVENGAVSASVMDDIIQNPSNYQIQFVEPLGFTGELFHGRSNTLNNPVIFPGAEGYWHADSQIDMSIHAKVQCELVNDSVFGTKRIVEGETPGQIGIPDGGEPSSNYVAFGLWRNQVNGSPTIPNSGGSPFQEQGNYLFNIKSVVQDTSNEENLVNNIFTLLDANGAPVNFYWDNGLNNDDENFTDNVTRNFQEPVYIINIVRSGATIASLDFQSLLSTGNFVKTNALIGYSNGQTNQSFVLCGERTVDCGKLPTDTLDRYAWVQDDITIPDLFRWINVSYLSGGDITIITNDINNGTTIYNGLRLYGMYTCDQTTNFNVVFSNNSFIPPNAAQIVVKYDNRFPVYAFGGDTLVGQANFPIVHRKNGTDNGNGDTNGWGTFLKWNRGMPYRWWKLKENYYVIRNTPAGGLPIIQNGEDLLGSHHPELHGADIISSSAIRQMIVMYYCQSYSDLSLAYGSFYPLVNYIMRPQEWDSGKQPHQQFIPQQYETDYPNEFSRWQLGGFQIKQYPFTLDYSKENISDLFDFVSQNFYSENTYFPNRVAWSNTRPIQTVLAPNLKTFLPNNIYDTSDNRGQIQRLHSFRHRLYGENIYALCESDFAILIANKSLISSATGDILAAVTASGGANFIQEEVWVNETKKAGLPGDFWKTFSDNGQEAFYANYNGVFLMTEKGMGTEIQSITEGYNYQLYKSLFSRVQRDTKFLSQSLGGVYNLKQKEYWLYFKTNIPTYNLIAGANSIPFISQKNYTSVPNMEIDNTHAGATVQFTLPSGNIYTQILIKIVSTVSSIQFKDNTGTNIFLGSQGLWYLVTYNPYSTGAKWTSKLVDKDLNEYRDTFLFAFSNSPDNKKWIGVFDYDFEKFLSFNNEVYGSRFDGGSIKTYKLDSGFQISGSSINARIYQIFNPQLQQSYMFNRFRINSNIKPDSIKFYNVDDISVSISKVLAVDMKNYHGYENLISRSSITTYKNSDVFLICQIASSIVGQDFFLNSLTFGYNKIR